MHIKSLPIHSMNMLMSGAARHCIPWFRDMCRDKTNVINLLEATIYTTEHITILEEVLIDFISRNLLSESGIVRVRTFARKYASIAVEKRLSVASDHIFDGSKPTTLDRTVRFWRWHYRRGDVTPKRCYESFPTDVFALMVLVSDGYLTAHPDPKAAAFFRVASQLPIDLQIVMANFVYGLDSSILTHTKK